MLLRGREPDDSGPVWEECVLQAPHAQADKAMRVRRMFDAIAPRYELVNRLASAGQDARWRREMVRLADVQPEDVLLDAACGTGDVSRAFAAARPRPGRIVGIDYSMRMLRLAADRPIQRGIIVGGDALQLPIADRSVSIVTCAFGIRNFQDLFAGLQEMHRVLRGGGRAVILEFTVPRRRLLRGLYLLYFNHVLPLLGRVIGGDRSGAYRYLPRSVLSFVSEEAVVSALSAVGFAAVRVHRRSLGIVSIYVATRADRPEVAR